MNIEALKLYGRNDDAGEDQVAGRQPGAGRGQINDRQQRQPGADEGEQRNGPDSPDGDIQPQGKGRSQSGSGGYAQCVGIGQGIQQNSLKHDTGEGQAGTDRGGRSSFPRKCGGPPAANDTSTLYNRHWPDGRSSDP